jgi:hypothetical protein
MCAATVLVVDIIISFTNPISAVNSLTMCPGHRILHGSTGVQQYDFRSRAYTPGRSFEVVNQWLYPIGKEFLVFLEPPI